MPKQQVVEGKKRIQFDFTDGMMERLKYCREKLDAISYAEVMRRALKFLEKALDDKMYEKDENGDFRLIKVI